MAPVCPHMVNRALTLHAWLFMKSHGCLSVQMCDIAQLSDSTGGLSIEQKHKIHVGQNKPFVGHCRLFDSGPLQVWKQTFFTVQVAWHDVDDKQPCVLYLYPVLCAERCSDWAALPQGKAWPHWHTVHVMFDQCLLLEQRLEDVHCYELMWQLASFDFNGSHVALLWRLWRLWGVAVHLCISVYPCLCNCL